MGDQAASRINTIHQNSSNSYAENNNLRMSNNSADPFNVRKCIEILQNIEAKMLKECSFRKLYLYKYANIQVSKNDWLSTRPLMIIHQLRHSHAYFKITTVDQSNDCEGSFHEILKNIHHSCWMDPKMITITTFTKLYSQKSQIKETKQVSKYHP